MHFDFVRPSGQWFSVYVPNQADFQRFDVRQFKSVNGDLGGSWSPTKPIILSGAGVALTSSGSVIGAGVKTQTGGRLVLGANDFPALGPTRSRSITFHVHDLLFDPAQLLVATGDERVDTNVVLQLPPAPMGVLLKSQATAQLSIPGRSMHSNNGAILTSIQLGYRITVRGATLPKIGGSQAMPLITFFELSDTNTSAQPTPGILQLAGWTASTHYAVGSYVVPTFAHDTGLYYKATSESGTGTSGTTEPTWPTIIGNTVTDNPGANQIVWTATGRSGRINGALSVDQYFNAGNAQILEWDADPAVPFTVDGTSNRFLVQIENPDPTMVLHTLTFSFSGISSYGFE